MKLKTNLIFSLFWMLVFTSFKTAGMDCIACFTMFKVRVELKDGSVKKGYIALGIENFEGQDMYYFPKTGEELISKGLKSYNDSVLIVGEIFQIPYKAYPLWVADSSSFKQYPRSKIKKIVCLGETKFSGASSINEMNHRDFIKLKKVRHFQMFAYEDGGVCETVCINTNPKLDSALFEQISKSEFIEMGFRYNYHINPHLVYSESDLKTMMINFMQDYQIWTDTLILHFEKMRGLTSGLVKEKYSDIIERVKLHQQFACIWYNGVLTGNHNESKNFFHEMYIGKPDSEDRLKRFQSMLERREENLFRRLSSPVINLGGNYGLRDDIEQIKKEIFRASGIFTYVSCWD